MRRALARVNLGAIERNCAQLARRAAPARLCAVVKADGYGHGAEQAARAALAGGAGRLAVATAGEAAALRAAGIAAPVLVLGALSEEELAVALGARADVVAWRAEFVARIAAAAGAHRAGVHVKLDTGMGRLGTRDAREADAVAEAVAAEPRLRLAGAMTHFATADDDLEFTRVQLERLQAWVQPLRRRHPDLVAHAANSAATLRLPAARLDMVRCGIAIYGLDPLGRDPGEHGLEPALALESYVAEVKRCETGESCGYGRKFVATEPRWIATVPIGYGDGVRRGLTNNADVLVDGRRVPLAGAVSMDNITLDLGRATDGAPAPAQRGAAAVLIGIQRGERILAEELARRLDTINYEVTCGISARVPRAYHRDGAPA